MPDQYATDGAIGVNLSSPSSASGATLGETHQGSDNTEWRAILAPIALTKGACVAIGPTNLANAVVATASTFGQQIAFAQTAFPASTYGWVASRGNNIFIQIVGGLAAPNGVPLYTTDTAGALSTVTASASQFQVWGVYMSTAVVGLTASANNGNAQYPMLRRPIA